jgi:hypothetical protein
MHQQPPVQPMYQQPPMQPMGGPASAMPGPAPAPAAGGGKKTGLIIGVVAGVLLVGGGVTAAVVLTGGGDESSSSTKTEEEDGDEAEPVKAEDPADEKEVETAAGTGAEQGDETKPSAFTAQAEAEAEEGKPTALGGLAKLNLSLRGAAGIGQVAAATGPVAELAVIRDHACACSAPDCVSGVQVEFEAWMKKYQDYQPTQAEQDEVGAIASAMSACRDAAMQAPPPQPTPVDPAPPPVAAATKIETGIPECDDYAVAIEEYLSCDKVPEDARTSTRDAMKDVWDQFRQVPEEYKAEVGKGCKQGADGIRDATKMLGCAGGTGTATVEAVATGGSSGLPNCDRFIELAEILATCEAMPASARDSFKQAADQMKASFGNLGSLPESSRAQIDDGCKQGVDGFTQSAAAVGCKI